MRALAKSIVLLATLGLLAASAAEAQDCFLGEMRMFAGNFAPRGWALAAGQILPISQNTALFSILGTTYGGNGQTTFALPDLRGRFPIGTGQGPGLTDRQLGEQGGQETVTLTSSEMPIHDHPLVGTNTAATHARPLGRTLAKFTPVTTFGYADATPDAPMSTGSIGVSGGGQPHANMPPFLGLTFIICLEGTFPSRN